ncbi:MAG: UvrB/UvrC motif-containing protein [Clostridia bacterium]|nr:UvrB/UvrC motif-containing protein [Clostridia bacterium]
MLCEECKTNEACYTISVMMGEAMTQRHLCADCMAKMNMNIATGNIKHLLGAIMAAISSTEVPAESSDEPKVDIVCERCKTTLSQFTKSGRLGCPGCYQAFREQLTPMLQQIHGRVQHAGRKPLDTEAAQRQRSEQEELSRQLERAVAIEDYETAAILRDRLKALAAKEVE